MAMNGAGELLSFMGRHASWQRAEGVPVVVRVVRLGSARVEGEGTRIGTVRRPTRDPLSQCANFPVGCCREDESHGHRLLVLRALLAERGARLQ